MAAATKDFSFEELGSKQKGQDEIIIQGDAGFKDRSVLIVEAEWKEAAKREKAKLRAKSKRQRRE